jgi:hypothetical protein
MDEKKPLTNVQAIKMFFEKDNGKPVTMDELKKLSPEERKELAVMAAVALNHPLAA